MLEDQLMHAIYLLAIIAIVFVTWQGFKTLRDERQDALEIARKAEASGLPGLDD